MTKQSSWEGSLLLNFLLPSGFVSVKTRLLHVLSSVTSSQTRHVLQCSLHFTIINSNYWNITLKPKKVKCFQGGNTQCIFRKGYCWNTANRLPEVNHFPPSTGSFPRQTQLSINILFFSESSCCCRRFSVKFINQ